MKLKNKLRITGCLATMLLVLASCSDWNKTESVDLQWHYWWDENPEVWAKYTAALRAYKQNGHFLTYAVFGNAEEKPGSEKCFMRNLPDSLDIVSLTNAENFSAHDAEDMTVMRDKGTKVLYQIDFAARRDELDDAAKLGACIDNAITSVKDNGLDGWSFTGTPKLGDEATVQLASLLVSRLSSAKQDSQLIVFEGDPMFIPAAEMEKIDLFVLNTVEMENVQDVRLAVIAATSRYNIPSEKILLAAKVNGILADEDKVEHPALEEAVARVMEFGPLCGIAAYNIDTDYWHSGSNYLSLRTAIQTLNPSK